jgi:hypothetical protein
VETLPTTSAFRCEDCGRLWTADDPPSRVHDHANGREVCGASVVAVKVVPVDESVPVERNDA